MNLPIDGQNHDITGTLSIVGQTKHLPSGTPYQDCQIDGENVRIWQGKGNPVPMQLAGTQQSFTLKAEQKGQYTNRGGFWKPNAQVQQQPASPNMPPQANNNVYQPPKKEPDWDKIAEGKVLCNVVCSAIQAGMIQVTNIQDAQKWTDFIMDERPQAAYQPPAQPEAPYGGPQYDPEDPPF